MLTKRDLLRFAALAAITATTTKAVPAGAQAKAEWPGIIEAKAIAEEGFIYGLPIVMNYAVMYEYSVDKNSGQYKAPFNQIKNEARVYTYKDTAVITPNSDTPYSLLSATRSITVTSAAARPAARLVTTWSLGLTGRVPHRPASRRYSSPRRSFLPLPTARSFSMRQTCRMLRRYRPATRCRRFPPI